MRSTALLLPLALWFAAGSCADDLNLAAPREGALVVAGSVNIDVTVRVARLPQRGETLESPAGAPSYALGGKGANQAVAAARLSNGTARPAARFVGRLGDDAHSAWLASALADAGVDAKECAVVPGLTAGQGVVLLDDTDGSATSIVLGGANAAGWPADDAALLADADRLLRGAAVLLLQREVPPRVNAAFAAAAAAARVPVLLDAGGSDAPMSRDELAAPDLIAPNEHELERLTGLPTGDDALALAAARALLARGARGVLATLGSRGALLLQRTGDGGERLLRQPALPLPGGRVVDATAAGDAFRAAFAVALAEGRGARGAMLAGAAAGAIAASRLGAAPSLPTRDEVEELLRRHGGADGADGALEEASAGGEGAVAGACATDGQSATGEAPAVLRFASRLNSMRARRDLAPAAGAAAGDDVDGWLTRQGGARGLTHAFLNHPQHTEGRTPAQLRATLAAAGLAAGAVCTRFPERPFRSGAMSAPDAAVRAAAVELAAEGCRWAAELGARDLIVWSPYDGYDYHLATDHAAAWNNSVAAFRALARECGSRGVRAALEWKPADAGARFSVVPSTGAALLLAREVASPHFGVVIDAGHALLAGENPAQSVALAASEGRLFGVQLGDAHARHGAEDGLAFASVNSASALELVYWLRRVRFDGIVFFDTFPDAEDPVREAEYNVRRFRALWERAGRLAAAGPLESAMAAHDAMTALEVLEADEARHTGEAIE